MPLFSVPFWHSLLHAANLPPVHQQRCLLTGSSGREIPASGIISWISPASQHGHTSSTFPSMLWPEVSAGGTLLRATPLSLRRGRDLPAVCVSS